MSYFPDPDTSSVFYVLAINGSIGIACLLLFEYFRPLNDIYIPKLIYGPQEVDGVQSNKSNQTKELNTNLKKPSEKFLMWVHDRLEVNDSKLLILIGLDGYVFLRFLKMCIHFTAICALIGLIILLPVYASSPTIHGVGGINIFTMANIEAGDNRLWASWLFTYIFTGIFLYLIHKEYEHFALVRKNFFKNGDPFIHAQMNYSILVENIPLECHSSQQLVEMFSKLFVNQVVCASLAIDGNALLTTTLQRNIAINKLEQAIASMEGDDKKKRPVIGIRSDRSPALCRSAESVDAIDYWKSRVTELNEIISKLQQQSIAEVTTTGQQTSPHQLEDGIGKMRMDRDIHNPLNNEEGKSPSNQEPSSHPIKLTSTGFVTFKTRSAQVLACQVPILFEQYPQVRVFSAPAPEDIVWQNIGTPLSHTASVESITYCVYIAGLLFWGVILAFVAAVSSLSNLATFLPFINSLDSVTYAILAGQLPVIILILFVGLIPTIMSAVSTHLEKRKSFSAIQFQVFKWFFLYQLANVLLILLAGSIFNSLADALSDPTSIITLLGAALPTVSVFFLNFTITAAFAGPSLLMLRLVPLIIYKLYQSCLFNPRKQTIRSFLEGPLAMSGVNYGVELPTFLYILLIALLYWTIAPLVVFGCFLLFLFYYFAWKYQYLYVVRRDFESGGQFWYGLYYYSMTGLMASTLIAIAFMGIKEGAAQAPMLVPLLIGIIMAWRYTEKQFKSFSSNLPFSSAVELDSNYIPPTATDQPSSDAIMDTFHSAFLRQPEISAPLQSDPLPYRIESVPLIDGTGCINPVYYQFSPATKP